MGLFKSRPKSKAKEDTLVLVVEDSEAIRMEVVGFFKRSGYKVMESENGQEALTLVQRLKQEGRPYPDLICSDVNMPQMDGLELLDNIRGHQDLKDIPFYILTANKDELLRLTAQGLKVNAFFMKPPRPELLEKQLAQDFNH